MRAMVVIALISAPAWANPRGGSHSVGHGSGRATPVSGSARGATGTVRTVQPQPVYQPKPARGAVGRHHHADDYGYGWGYGYSGGGYDDCDCNVEPVAYDEPPQHYYIPADDVDGLDQPRVQNNAPHTSVDCLDIAVTQNESRRSIELTYDVRNRCDAPVAVDLGSTVVASRTPEGAATWLTAFDPHHDLGSFWLAPLGATSATISYTSKAATTTICVDAASLAGRTDAKWLCIE